MLTDARGVAAQQVIVKPGDSLSGIASRTGASLTAIAVANRLARPYAITIGQKLTIPAGRYHNVKPGETGIAIARAYGIDWDEVITANDLQPPYVLRAGERLRLPTRAAAQAMTLEQRAAAFRIDIDDLISGSEPAEHADAPPAKAGKTQPPVKSASLATATKPVAPADKTTKADTGAKPVAETRTEAHATGRRFDWPVEGVILSAFGVKSNGRYNDGINIKAASGAPFRAAADGVVAYAGDAIEGFGNLLLIKHSDGWVTAYAHAETLLVTRNAKVARGDIVGRVGRTGSVDSSQLHFEIRRGRTPVDPRQYLRSN